MNSIEFIYGERKIILKPPVIRQEITKRRFWFDKIEYYVDCTLGPFKKYEDAYDTYKFSLPYMS